MIGTLFVDLNAFDLMSIYSRERIEVTKWCDAMRSPTLGFFSDSFLGFVREVLGIELRDRGHDAVQQRAGWSVIDLFTGRDQHGAGLMNLDADHDVVGSVPGQSVELVNNDEVEIPDLDSG